MIMYKWSGPSDPRTVDLRPVHVKKQKDSRPKTIAAGCISGFVASVGAAGYLLPYTAIDRGRFAVGGEWLAIIGFGILAGYIFSRRIERRRVKRGNR